MGESMFVQGNEACARGAIYANLRFFAGYPITPSTEIAESLAELLPKVGGKFVQMEDEISSMCAICGASLAGMKVMTATSGPGFSLKQEAIGYAIMTEIPCVIVDAQRGGPSTGLPTEVSQGDVMQARWGVHGDHSIIALTASSVQDVFEITVEAFNMAETLRTSVVLLLDAEICHMRERLTIPDPGELHVVDRLYTEVKPGVAYHPYLPREDGRLPISNFGDGHRFNVTGLHHDIWGFPTQNPDSIEYLNRHLYDKIENRTNRLARWKEYDLDDADIVLISYGSAARSARQHVFDRRRRGEKLGLLELQTIWPFPADLIREKTARARRVIVAEMNMGQICSQVKSVVEHPERVFLANRIDGRLITPENIARCIRLIDGRGF